ncbi:MAG: Smr/MutS family protein [Rhodobacteraceae bacterium]|jgi:DNA-nicking Smr family endonuclease|nr:Smr/MutS family protein [Paracoccaceae bacterium]
MTRRRHLPLGPDDAALWERLAATVRPLHPPLPAALGPARSPQSAADGAVATLPAVPAVPESFGIGERAAQGPATRIVLASEAPPPPLDRRRLARLARGTVAPEARIDLHGLTLAEAQPELTRFVQRSHARGLGLVLVITGKGRTREDGAGPVPERPGMLRRQVPQWLRTPPLAAAVSGIAEAHLRHGGAGAFYVSLRRRR